ncbi:hypothetical protein JCM5350_000614 [Sporobolomyces pararoseus]
MVDARRRFPAVIAGTDNTRFGDEPSKIFDNMLGFQYRLLKHEFLQPTSPVWSEFQHTQLVFFALLCQKDKTRDGPFEFMPCVDYARRRAEAVVLEKVAPLLPRDTARDLPDVLGLIALGVTLEEEKPRR